VSQVAGTANQLLFVLAAVDRVINKTVAYEKIPLITVLPCDIYLAFKILTTFCSQQKRKHGVIV